MLSEEAPIAQIPHESTYLTTYGNIYLGLSGGGFRATAHHMGVMLAWLRYNQHTRLRVMNGVSGGAITVAWFNHWIQNRLITNCNRLKALQSFAIPLIKLMQAGIRNRALLGVLSDLIVNPFAKRKISRGVNELVVRVRKLTALGDDKIIHALPALLPTTSLERVLDKYLFEGITMRELASDPLLTVLTATDWHTGRPVFLTPLGIKINPQRLYTENVLCFPYRGFPLARAVAASAAFPPTFAPVEFVLKGDDANYYTSVTHKQIHDEVRVFLLDGGISDNRAISYIAEMAAPYGDVREIFRLSNLEHILIYDAGKESSLPSEPGIFFAKRAALDIIYDRKEQSLYDAVHAYSSMYGAECDRVYRVMCELHDVLNIEPDVLKLLMNVRTDLNAFSDTEIYVLAYAGYRLAIMSLENNKWITNKNGPDYKKHDLSNEVIQSEFAEILSNLNPLPDTMWRSHLLGSVHRGWAKRGLTRYLASNYEW